MEKQLNRAIITVIARSYSGQKIYVAGEIFRPGEIEMTGRLNALEAIFRAGGFRVKTAKTSQVVIISRGPNNTPIARKVNLKKALKGDLPEKEYLLRPFDLVYVPRTGLAKAEDLSTQIMRTIPTRIWRGLKYEPDSSFEVIW